jgi:predicted permease
MDYVAMRERTAAFGEIGAYVGPRTVDLGRGESAEQVNAVVVSANFLDILGVQPALGRFFVAVEDGTPDAHRVAVISYAMWQSRFAGVSDVVGKAILVNGLTTQVVGVTAKGFTGIGSEGIDVWLPSSLAGSLHIVGDGPGKDWRQEHRLVAVQYVVRLRSAADELRLAHQAASALSQVATPDSSLDRTPEVRTTRLVLAAGPAHQHAAKLSLWLVLISGFVLAITCANVANLLMARGISKRRDFAIRLALGASGGRIVRGQLIESALAGVVGGAAGILLAYAAMGLMRQFPLPPSAGEVDARILAFAVGLSLVTGLMCGIIPAIRSIRIDPIEGLQHGRVGSYARYRPQRLLLALQISLSLILLTGAGLFIRSVVEVRNIKSGVDIDHLLVAAVDLRSARYAPEQSDAFLDGAVERVSTLPGVQRASVAHFRPFSGGGFGVAWRPPDQAKPHSRAAFLNLVGPSYFETVGTKLLRGRAIGKEDRFGDQRVGVVNEAFAKLIREDGNVVGLCVPMHRQIQSGNCTQIVGVAENQRHSYLVDQERPMIFWPRAQAPTVVPFGVPAIIVRTARNPRDHVQEVRAGLQNLRPDLPYVRVRSLRDELEDTFLPFELGAALFAIFGAIALTLSGIGLYGVLDCFVRERTADIGIRRSLGSSTAALMVLVMRHGFLPIAVGSVVGFGVAVAGARYLESLLFGVAAWDSLSFGGAVIFLLCIAAISMLLPAWRAAHIDPAMALRQE